MFFVVATIFSRKVATPALAGGARENAKFLSFFATSRLCGFARAFWPGVFQKPQIPAVSEILNMNWTFAKRLK